MIHPTVIEPQQLVPAGGEFDPTKVVACLCHHQNAIGRVKLVWADYGDNGPGWYACCSWQCHLKHFTEGHG